MNAHESPPVVRALTALVEQRHNGSRSRAARSWGVSRSTAFSWLAERPHVPRRAHIEAVAAAERVDLAALMHGQVVPVAKQGTASSPADALARLAELAAHPVAKALARVALGSSDARERVAAFSAREAFCSPTRPRSWRGDGDATMTGAGRWSYGRDRRAVGVEAFVIEPAANGRAVARPVVLTFAAADAVEADLDVYVSRIEGEDARL